MNKTMKILAVALPLALGLSSQTATAATYDVGTVSGNYSTLNTVTDSFFDTINFSIGSLSNIDISANSLFLSSGGFNIYDITGLTVTFWDNHHPDGLIDHGGAFAGNNTTNSFFSLAPGDYHLDIEGTGNGLNNNGAYAVSLNVTAVPEPETYALMLGGLALVGFAARRKQA